MTILGLETSCDETGAALIEANPTTKQLTLVSNIISSSLSLHATTGGIIPENAAREQIKSMIPVLQEALIPISPNMDEAMQKIDAIAITYGPGLIGSLLVGVETARTLSLLYNKPIISVNHMLGHIYANWINQNKEILFPSLALVVSGGHTDLILLKDHNDCQVIGGTRDDAAGEAFDKVGRLLNLPYPAGPIISQLAKKGNPKAYRLPRPMWDSKDYDFSFSGLKTAVLNEVKKLENPNEKTVADLCAAVEQSIVDILVKKTMLAAKEYNTKSLLMGGGVAANEKLRETLEIRCSENDINFFVPPRDLCTDNAAMIAAAGFFLHQTTPWQILTADPELYY